MRNKKSKSFLIGQAKIWKMAQGFDVALEYRSSCMDMHRAVVLTNGPGTLLPILLMNIDESKNQKGVPSNTQVNFYSFQDLHPMREPSKANIFLSNEFLLPKDHVTL